MWTCSLNNALCEPLRPAQTLKIYTHVYSRCEVSACGLSERKYKKRSKINMFIWYFSLNTHFLMHCKRPSGFFNGISLNVYLSVRMPVSLILWVNVGCSVNTSHFTFSLFLSLFLLRRHYRFEINQYKANNWIVYIIYLSGATIYTRTQAGALLYAIQTITLTVIVITVFILGFYITNGNEWKKNVYFYFFFFDFYESDLDREISCGVKKEGKNCVDIAIGWLFFPTNIRNEIPSFVYLFGSCVFFFLRWNITFVFAVCLCCFSQFSTAFHLP